MVPVRRIAHASFETPDPERLIAYYTDVIGLSVVGRDKDAAYLASLEDHAVVVRRGPEPRCVRLAFQIAPDDDLGAFEKGINGHGIKTARKKDPEPGISELVTFEDPKGTLLEVFRERELPKAPEPGKGIARARPRTGACRRSTTGTRHPTRSRPSSLSSQTPAG